MTSSEGAMVEFFFNCRETTGMAGKTRALYGVGFIQQFNFGSLFWSDSSYSSPNLQGNDLYEYDGGLIQDLSFASLECIWALD